MTAKPPLSHGDANTTFLRLGGVIHGDRNQATVRVRDAFDEAGAFITDVHLFSGLQTTLSFEVAADRQAALACALEAAGLSLNDASRAALAHVNTGEVQGTLVIVFAEGDPELTHEVPAVPG